MSAGPWAFGGLGGFEGERELGLPREDRPAIDQADLEVGQIDGGGEGRLVDEGIAVPLEPGDGVVALAFGIIGRVFGMPTKEGAEPAHGRSGAGDQAGVLDETEVGLAGGAFVADIHVEECPGEVAAFGGRWHPRVAVGGAERGFRVRGLGVAGIGGSGNVEPLVPAGGVHVSVAGTKVVEVRVGGESVVDAEGVRPEVLAVPARGGAEGGDRKGSPVNKSHKRRRAGNKVDLGEGVGGVEAGGAGVGQGLVAGADEDVEVGADEWVREGAIQPSEEKGQEQKSCSQRWNAHPEEFCRHRTSVSRGGLKAEARGAATIFGDACLTAGSSRRFRAARRSLAPPRWDPAEEALLDFRRASQTRA